MNEAQTNKEQELREQYTGKLESFDYLILIIVGGGLIFVILGYIYLAYDILKCLKII